VNSLILLEPLFCLFCDAMEPLSNSCRLRISDPFGFRCVVCVLGAVVGAVRMPKKLGFEFQK
jgi:hypothetical protein